VSKPGGSDGPVEWEHLVRRLADSKKYRCLCEDTIRDVVEQECARHDLRRTGEWKKAEAGARKRLHRVWASYLGAPDIDSAEKRLSAAFGGKEPVEEACREILTEHQSSRERIPILGTFFQGIFRRTGTPAILLDLACALNPLAFRWMGLPRSTKYRAFDINAKTVGLINHYFRLEGMEAAAELRDVLCKPPMGPADAAFLFKMYHCLEHRRRGAGWEVVAATPAEWIAVSFPTRNLANRRIDIAANYEQQIRSDAAERGWPCGRMDFDSEVVLLVHKGSGTE